MVGCAEVLQGGVDAADFVDIDLESARVTMVTCDDVEQPIPFIVERVIVDLGRLKVSVDRRERGSTPLYFKSRFLPEGDKLLDGQAEVEAALSATGLFEPGLAEPGWDKLAPALKEILSRPESGQSAGGHSGQMSLIDSSTSRTSATASPGETSNSES
jgi:hypothetical protein